VKGICSDCQSIYACQEDHPPVGRMRVMNPDGEVTWCSAFAEYEEPVEDVGALLEASAAAEDWKGRK